MIARLRTGSPRLDHILGGGLVAQSINLVAGLPGTGKTILAQQMAFANATEDRPALYLSTTSEPLEKILRYAETLEFFDAHAIGRRVHFEDLGGDLAEGGLAGAQERLEKLLAEQSFGMLVIDSFRAIGHQSGNGTFPGFIHEIAGVLSALPTTSLWLGEYGREELESSPEFAVVDGVLFLSSEESGAREARTIRVLKLRGSGHLSGSHSYRITSAGIEAYPRLSDPVDRSSYELRPGKTTSGVRDLDALLGDGLWPGSTTLVAGPTGSGKTVLGLHFAYGGATAGEPAVFSTLQENEVQLERMIEGFGWGMPFPGVTIRVDTPNDIYIDQWFHDVMDEVERAGARRLVIDGLGDLQASAPDEKRFREFLHSLTSRCSRAGVSVLATQEVSELFGLKRISEIGTSQLADNVILLQYARSGSELQRALTIVKTRASFNVPETRLLTIQRGGVAVGGPIDAP